MIFEQKEIGYCKARNKGNRRKCNHKAYIMDFCLVHFKIYQLKKLEGIKWNIKNYESKEL